MADTIRTDLIIKESTNYGQFKKLLGNRDISKARIKNIKESILRIGYQPAPILINENWEIIDGQGRAKAAEELSLPILYIQKAGLTINDCISMNIKMKNWSEIDYIKSFADRGNEDYRRLYDLIVEYSVLPRPCIYEIALGGGFGSATSGELLNGRVKCPEITYDMHESLRWLSAAQAYMDNKAALKILAKLDNLRLIDKSRMLDSLEKYSTTKKIKSRSADDILLELNELYNYNRRKIIYFTDAYKEKTKAFTKKNRAA